MALVSPGISISINDQSQYVNANVGSVPLVVLATEQDKTYNGSPATSTSKANAGKLLSFSSQRDLVTQMGTPKFQLSSSGTPVNGDETNEYGLLAAHSALGLTNQLFAIRADIDLAQLTGTTIRPTGAPANGQYWLDTVNTTWGLYALDAVAGDFVEVTPLVVTDPTHVQYQTINGTTSVSVPLSSIGTIGSYAIVAVNPDGSTPISLRLFYKKGPDSYIGSIPSNSWIDAYSPDWQSSLPVVTGTVANPTIPVNSTFTINTVTVTSDGTTTTLTGANGLVAKINAATIPGVYANVSSTGKLELFATSAAKSTGATADGKIIITDGTNTPMSRVGIRPTAYFCPILFYGNFAQAPVGGWFANDQQPRPSGSLWWKTSAAGGGFSPMLKRYNASLNIWQSLSVSMYSSSGQAIYALDPIGGGTNIEHGTVIASLASYDTTYNALRLQVQLPGSQSIATAGTPGGTVGAIGNTFTLKASQPGSPNLVSATITTSGTSIASLVSDILSANIPYITAQVDTNGTISIIHTTGGSVILTPLTGTVLTSAGFVTGEGAGFVVSPIDGSIFISLWANIGSTYSIKYQSNAPYSPPTVGTLWYNSDAVDIDVMINNNGWKGYRNVTSDVRGFDLTSTDTKGVIVSPSTAPTSQSDNSALMPGDLWLDSGDLVNYPSLYRYNGNTWVAIDTKDHTSQNGIVFADARWDTNGTTDVITGSLPEIATLLTSDYLDLDAPDYRLFPRGALLFNMRRSGYNVKRFVPNYFNETSFPNVGTNVEGLPTALPTVRDAWVTASGLDANEVMFSGTRAQRNMVVGAMQAAIDSNLDVLSPIFQFNLLVAPNYPEVIPNLLTLNDNRGDTAFVIGDTPMDLAPNAVTIGNWINDTNGSTGYVIPASPYLALYYPSGRTNDLAGNEVVVPASHAVLRTYLYNDQVSYPWFAPAGTQRGLVNNWSDIGYMDSETGGFIHNAVSAGLRDALFTLNINPITQLPGSGIVVWGQLTRSGSTTARDRVNVVRLENYLRTIFQSVANGYLFEPNDSITRKSITAAIAGSLNTILSHRGLYDFLVICDSSNNTSATISNNQLYVDVAIEPERDVEFIYIPIAIYNPGSIATLK